ncbi:hypothetical protein SD37_23350 [Amycolatopsis orientalis]|uniref:DUF2076 domain-containing protein n=1 Tax=Amycolatopsis orientalis TaxID=31958 RepID=A0A193C1C9_AMYOR|nr:DUF2076 family protein [Amycolatopsis orientalis]ANN18282.1 hypothetical protein SD37_23350 [Amycolatopsis orientalis]
MEYEDRQLILGLADRLRQARPVHKDPEVADLIARQIAGQPDALYLLVGAVLMQEDALRNAKTRIAELERSAPYQDPYGNHRDPYGAQRDPYGQAPAQSGGGFFSGMFGRGRDTGPAAGEAPQGRPGGGGFLKTAAAAAAGVAGGGLLLGGLTGAFSGHEASAGEQQHHGGQDDGMDHGGGDDQW